MKTKSSKHLYESSNSSELIKVAIVALLVMILLIGAGNLFSVIVSALI